MKTELAGSLWFAHSAVGARRWRRLAADPERAQREHLLRILRANGETAFGREHDLRRIGGAADYARRVPVRGYDDFAPYIERIAAGESSVLTREPVRHFAVSSGTTSASKLIPYTASLLREFQSGVAPWIHRLFRDNSHLLRTTTYWSITPVAAARRSTPAGIPVGFEDERSYLDRASRLVLGTLMPLPSAVARIGDMETFRYVTLRLLLQQRSLGWLSVWSPSFLTLLVEPLERWHERLLDDLERGVITSDVELPPPVVAAARAQPARARELRSLFASYPPAAGDAVCERVWPRLRLISCWGHGSAAALLPGLRRYFPNVSIEPKGLLATEAFVSFPYSGDLSALSLGSHFFEFLDGETGETALAHQLSAGKIYSLLVTTAGGLYRYRLGDLVEVGGFAARCPLIRFIEREEGGSDLHGEKLSEHFVRGCGEELFARFGPAPSFWLLAPQGGSRYALFVRLPRSQKPQARLGAELDLLLRRNFHYDYCRRLGQLEECRLFEIPAHIDAAAAFHARRAEQGQRLGDVKPTILDRMEDWAERFEARPVS